MTLMLMDKGYYDYDYCEPRVRGVVERHERTHEQTQSIFSRMGFGKVKRIGDRQEGEMTAEEMQRVAMNDE